MAPKANKKRKPSMSNCPKKDDLSTTNDGILIALEALGKNWCRAIQTKYK